MLLKLHIWMEYPIVLTTGGGGGDGEGKGDCQLNDDKIRYDRINDLSEQLKGPPLYMIQQEGCLFFKSGQDQGNQSWRDRVSLQYVGRITYSSPKLSLGFHPD